MVVLHCRRSIARLRDLLNEPSFLRLLEIPQIRRRLVLPGGHQQAVRAQVVVLLADDDIHVALGAENLAPVRTRIRVAPKGLVDAPGPRQGVVEHGDLVMQKVRIVPVEMEAFLEGRLIVEGERQPGRVVASNGPRVSTSSTS